MTLSAAGDDTRARRRVAALRRPRRRSRRERGPVQVGTRWCRSDVHRGPPSVGWWCAHGARDWSAVLNTSWTGPGASAESVASSTRRRRGTAAATGAAAGADRPRSGAGSASPAGASQGDEHAERGPAPRRRLDLPPCRRGPRRSPRRSTAPGRRRRSNGPGTGRERKNGSNACAASSGVKPGPAVGDLEHRVVARLRDPDRHRRPRRRVEQRVRQQVPGDLAQARLVGATRPPARRRVQRDRRARDRRRARPRPRRPPARRGRPARARAHGSDPAERAAAGPRPARPSGRTSSSIRRIDFSRSSRRSRAPRRNSSAYPRIDVRGVRSSCEASARNRRSRSSDALRSANATSICASIAFSATPSCPTSVRSSSWGTRRVRSPAAIAPAVTPISLERPELPADQPPGQQPEDQRGPPRRSTPSISRKRSASGRCRVERHRDDQGRVRPPSDGPGRPARRPGTGATRRPTRP